MHDGSVTPPTQHATRTAPAGLVALVVGLFFIWGGLTSLNDVLVPKLKALFELSYAEAMLTQFAFFTAYFVVSLPAGRVVARVRYVQGMVFGLALMAGGCLLFVPASTAGVYAMFLLALFVLAAGITVLQVAANPLIAQLGAVATSHSRLTLAQAFNSLGTTVFPPLGAALILGSLASVDQATLDASALRALHVEESAVIGHAYLAIAVVLLACAAVFAVLARRLPRELAAETNLRGSVALLRQHPRLRGAVACIFIYVGAEVAIGSVLVSWLSSPDVMAVTAQVAGQLLAFYWGGAMLGRFAGAWMLRRFVPGSVLACFALAAATLGAIAALSSGPPAGWALLAVGLANSIMFPTVFSLGVEGLDRDTPRGSGLLCMAIVGGALIPLLFGLVADATTLRFALIVPVACYLGIAAFGWRARQPWGPT